MKTRLFIPALASLPLASYFAVVSWSAFSHLEISAFWRLALLFGYWWIAYSSLKKDFAGDFKQGKAEKWPLIGLATIIGLIFFSDWQFPYPPVFHIHTFGVLDIARSIAFKNQLPLLETLDLAPNSVFVVSYPSHLVLGFLISFGEYFLANNLTAFRWLNVFSALYFLSVSWAIFRLILDRKMATRALSLFLILSLAFPPFFETFLKFPASDFSAFPLIFLFLAALFRMRNSSHGKLTALLSFAVASSLRIYLMPIMGLVLISFLLKNRYTGSIASLRKDLTPPRLVLTLAILLSWPAVFYGHYNTFWNDFAAIQNPKSVEVKTAKEFRAATNRTQVLEGTAVKELAKGFFASSIYYKTFTRPSLLEPWGVQISEILGTPAFLVLLILYLVLIGLNQPPFWGPAVHLGFIWSFALVFTVLLLNSSQFPMVKIVGMTAGAAFFVVALLRALGEVKRWHYLEVGLLAALVSMATWHQFVSPILETEFAGSDFRRKFGNREKFLETLVARGSSRDNTLWVVRAEHGGFTPQLLGGYLSDYLWYDSPKLNDLHGATTNAELIESLSRRGIEFVVAGPPADTLRFFAKPFREILGKPEMLLSEIEFPAEVLEPVFEEPYFRGLELRLFKVRKVALAK